MHSEEIFAGHGLDFVILIVVTFFGEPALLIDTSCAADCLSACANRGLNPLDESPPTGVFLIGTIGAVDDFGLLGRDLYTPGPLRSFFFLPTGAVDDALVIFFAALSLVSSLFLL